MNRAVFLSLGVLCALLILGCDAEADISIGGKSFDDVPAVEETIAIGLAEQADLPQPGVDCSGLEDIDVKEGETFECTGTAPNGEQFPIEITLTDDEGGYRYFVPENAGAGA